MPPSSCRPHLRRSSFAVAEVTTRYELPVLVVGRGSNLLVADTGFAGVAMSLAEWADRTEIRGMRACVPDQPSLFRCWRERPLRRV